MTDGHGGPAKIGGAKRDRTADLYNAIVALSQLSYGPKIARRRGSNLVAAAGLPSAWSGKIGTRQWERKRKMTAPVGGGHFSATSDFALKVLVEMFHDFRHVIIVRAQIGDVFDQRIFFVFGLNRAGLDILAVEHF